jgi:hypothetical protein
VVFFKALVTSGVAGGAATTGAKLTTKSVAVASSEMRFFFMVIT